MSFIYVQLANVKISVVVPLTSVYEKMKALKENSRRKLIGEFSKEHRDQGKIYTVNHFKRIGILQNSIYDVIKRVENGKTFTRIEARKMSKRKKKQLFQKAVKNLNNLIENWANKPLTWI